MKEFISFTSVFFCLWFNVIAQTVPENIAAKAALSKINNDYPGGIYALGENDNMLAEAGQAIAYVFPLKPQGYMIVSARYELPPVLAYSYTDNLDFENRLINMIKDGLTMIMSDLYNIPELEKTQNLAKWDILINNTPKSTLFQQWPPAGTTTTGGWLETKWNQTSPYNSECPMDPVSGNRSIAGCPAVAMAQIVNYHNTINGVAFSDADDYHHNYQGRNYWIDDDYDSLDFPSFPDLNGFLYSISQKYQSAVALTSQERAALIFACGVGATQVFTSSGSGTFGVSQAMDAYQKFNFIQAELLYANDTSIYTRMIQNMKDSLPVHFAVVNPTSTAGHNVVVDGYNTDNYFHVNFGWGGSSNGWMLTPSAFPSSLTVIEGVILDIIPNPLTGITEKTAAFTQVFPNPVRDILNVILPCFDYYNINLYSLDGRCVRQINGFGNKGQVQASSLSAGAYIMDIQQGDFQSRQKLIVQ